jgi:hypothetical protein
MKVMAVLCYVCEHFNFGVGNCKAFPRGIPIEIKTMKYDHRQPFNGDHGVQWAPDRKRILGENDEVLSILGLKKSDYDAPPDGDAE